MRQQASEMCVAHLVRALNGVEPFEKFIESYRAHDAGTSHELLLIFKGFQGATVPAEYEALLDGIQYKLFFLSDEGFDVRAYFLAARAFGYRFYCFLNSFSVIGGGHGWLAKMRAHAERDDVGVVGATGSYESLYANLAEERRQSPPNWHSYLPHHIGDELAARLKLLKWKASFDPFPNPHVRTNAFVLRRDVLQKLKRWEGMTKMDAHRFESGKRGLTRQIKRMGLKALLVGRDGEAYEEARWPDSRTYRSGAQMNLLVADNRTRDYLALNAEQRRALIEVTWGKDRAEA